MPSGACCLARWNDFVSTSEPHPLYNALWGTLAFEVNFTGWGDPCQKCLWGRLGHPVKFSFGTHPRHRYLRGTLPFEMNFTATAHPCQKCLWGRLGDLVKSTLPGIAIKSFSVLHKDFLK